MHSSYLGRFVEKITPSHTAARRLLILHCSSPYVSHLISSHHQSFLSYRMSHLDRYLHVLPDSHSHILKTCVRLVMPSNTHVLSIGTYCFVMSFMTSCATIPPVKAEILCNSPICARATSFAARMTRPL
jgi:hypothetical protein